MTQEQLNEIILKEVREEIEKETDEVKNLFTQNAKNEMNLIQRIWYTVVVKLLGSFSVNIQIKRNGVIIFEYEIPKR